MSDLVYCVTAQLDWFQKFHVIWLVRWRFRCPNAWCGLDLRPTAVASARLATAARFQIKGVRAAASSAARDLSLNACNGLERWQKRIPAVYFLGKICVGKC